MDYPTGMIPRVEAQQSHQSFVRAVEPDTIMMKITHARRLMRNDESFDSYFYPGVDVITTTTINDTQLNLLPWDQEWDIIQEMEPAYHIPTDYSDYSTQPLEERRENVRKCMEGTVWMHEQIKEAGLDTQVVPLLKGMEREERELCYAVYDEVGFEYAALYATRYFTGGAGNNIRLLEEDVEMISEETDANLLLIGLLSPNYLRRMSENVVAGAGHKQWLEAVEPRENDAESMQAAYADVREEIDEAVPGE